jgi:outer membrane lipoprotein-sorting protein
MVGKLSVGIVAALLAVTSLGSSQDEKGGRELLKEVSQVYKNLKSYHFEGVMVIESKANGVQWKMDTTMVAAAVKPDKIRVEMMGILMVSSGQTKWVYIPDLKQYSQNALVKVGERHLSLFALYEVGRYEHIAERVKAARILGQEAVEVQGKSIDCTVVQVEYDPLGIGQPLRTFWIDKARHIVLRESLKIESSPINPIDVKQTFIFTIAKVNEPIPDSLFVFIPPEGAKEVKELSFPSFPGTTRTDLIGREAFDFTLKDLDGREVNLRDLRGKVVLLSFWASWCDPCRAEMPSIEKLHREFKDKGLVVLGINAEPPEIARQFLSRCSADGL